MEKQDLNTIYHCKYSLRYHLVLVTKYRKRCISAKMLARLEDIFAMVRTVFKKGPETRIPPSAWGSRFDGGMRVCGGSLENCPNHCFGELCIKWEGELVEFSGEADHVHLLVSLNPKTGLTKFVNNVKTVSSRLIRKEFSQEVDQHYSKRVFWSRSYCVVTCGGAPLSVIKQYIEGQDAPS